MGNKAIFLDRDGVINKEAGLMSSEKEFKFWAGSQKYKETSAAFEIK